MKKITLFFFTAILTSGFAGDIFVYPHDISVRITLTTHLNYRQKFPQPSSQPPPEYPSGLRAERIAGEAKIKFQVAASGAVSNIRVVASQREFGESAVSAVQKWSFIPGLDVDQKTPIPFELEYLIQFLIHEEH